MRRFIVLTLLLATPLLAGCETFLQDVYDERAEDECEQILDTEAQRACLNELEDERWRRD
ncbi:MAG: hypothetical protein ABL308_00050 [Oceanicaulis sp.]